MMNNTRTQLLEQLLNHLGYISRSISAPHSFSFGEIVLTKPLINIFFFVAHHKNGVSVKDIAKFLNVTKGAVSQFIDTLVEKNLVKREEDARDRRLQCIRLTEFAESRFDQFKKSYYLSLNTLFDALNDEEVEQLVALLEKLSRSDDSKSC
jgi:DNA-binding MarR family transcriptional regulator